MECVAYTCGDRIRIADAVTGEEVASVHDDTATAWMSASGRLVSCYEPMGRQAHVHDVVTGAYWVVPGLQWPAPVLVGRLLVCSHEGSRGVQAVDLATGRVAWEHRTCGGHSPAVLTAGGSLVLVAEEVGPVQVLDLWPGHPLLEEAVLQWGNTEVRSLHAGGDGRGVEDLAVVATEHGACVRTGIGRVDDVPRWGERDPSMVALCPTGRVLAAATWDGLVRVWHTEPRASAWDAGSRTRLADCDDLELSHEVRCILVHTVVPGGVLVVAVGPMSVVAHLHQQDAPGPSWTKLWQVPCLDGAALAWCSLRHTAEEVEIEGYLVHV